MEQLWVILPELINEKNGIELIQDHRTPLYLVDNEGLMIHTSETLWTMYKDTNLCEPSDNWYDSGDGEDTLGEILAHYEDALEHDYFDTVGMKYNNDNFFIERIA